ncbi:MAG: hypothetical protein NUW37_12815 [Planctomycetes bacterium]|nr:hypothetical protein [Planctomycetota bacterium]
MKAVTAQSTGTGKPRKQTLPLLFVLYVCAIASVFTFLGFKSDEQTLHPSVSKLIELQKENALWSELMASRNRILADDVGERIDELVKEYRKLWSKPTEQVTMFSSELSKKCSDALSDENENEVQAYRERAMNYFRLLVTLYPKAPEAPMGLLDLTANLDRNLGQFDSLLGSFKNAGVNFSSEDFMVIDIWRRELESASGGDSHADHAGHSGQALPPNHPPMD